MLPRFTLNTNNMIRKELFETIDGNVAKTGLEKY